MENKLPVTALRRAPGRQPMNRRRYARVRRRSAAQDVAHLFRQIIDAERFGDQCDAVVMSGSSGRSSPYIGRRHEHLEPGIALAHFIRQLPAIHEARQSDIGEQQAHVRSALQDVQCGACIRRLQNEISETTQHLRAEATHGVVVLDDQYGVRTVVSSVRRVLQRSDRLFGRILAEPRQVN